MDGSCEVGVLVALISLFTVIGQFLYVYLELEAYAESLREL